MKRKSIFRTLAVLLTISLLLIALPSTPALAATIVLSPTSGPVGTWVTVTGSLFTGLGGNTVYIFLDNDPRVSVLVAPTYETISTQFQILSGTTTGQKTVSVKTTTSPTSTTLAIAYFTVTVIEIDLDEDSGPVGNEVEVTGEGFGDEEDLIVEYDDDDITDDIISGDTETDDDGEFAFTIAIPESATGDHTITVTGEDSDITASADFEVEPKITIAPDSGKRNDTIAITGTGFPDDEDITITFDGASVTTSPLSVESDSDGSFSASFVVPNSSGGVHTVKASHGTYDDTASFIVSATLTLDQTTGYIGTEVNVSGTGFQAGQPVTVYFDNTSVAANVVNTNGSVSVSFTVPSHAAGTFKVRVTDQTNSIELDFQILTSAEISQTSGHIGTELTASGVGFTAGRTVTVKYDGTQITSTTVQPDGSFSITFGVPVSTGGQHVITVSDTIITQQFAFVIESTPPSTVFAQLPLMDSKLADWRFDWSGNRNDLTQEVTDDSLPVTYTLQIATDDSFSANSIVLEKTGLTESEYTLTKEERLPSVDQESPYHWRVRAIDAASNATAWTGTGSFYVGFSFSIPQPVIYTLFGVGALLLGVLGFWLGRKTAYY